MKTPRYITTDIGPDGKERFYFRRPGQSKVRINGVPWTPSFMAEYEAAKGGVEYRQPLAPKIGGTFRWLCDLYFTSGEFRELDDKASKPKRRNTLLRICREPIAPNSKVLFGDVPLASWSKKSIRAIRDRFAITPGTANDMMKSLRTVFKFAVDAEHCEVNPTRDISYMRGSAEGHHSWEIGEVVTFEARWPIGTKERLAMGLLLYTGQRISDARKLGPQHVKKIDGDDWLVFTQHKNRTRKPVNMEIPLRPELRELIEATTTGDKSFLISERGEPFSENRAIAWFSGACIAANVPGRSHGLRKAAAARLAELGATEKEIMAITGHTTMQEIVRYTKAASNRKLAVRATALSEKGNK